ncbi:MAG TPA: tyrosine-type recombinase/integrase [Candidatus Bathyarchaeia archaeon]|nr:tyrosine-type recombinase/integrase [Candidatus Bathyarchaeia archaeon]
MLSLWRRHESKCPHKAKGRVWTKCSCPVWCDGEHSGRRVRQSLETRDWARAGRKLSDLEDRLNKEARGETEPERKRKNVSDAISIFLGQCEIEPSTMRKYRRVLNLLSAFSQSCGITFIDECDLNALDEYKLTRPLCSLSWQKELQLLRTFFEFCLERDWVERNPAKKMKMPPDPKPKPRQPYTQTEIIRILAACDSFGKSSYERLRAKAMILLMRYYGLRVSDVATLRKDRVKNDHLFLHAVKNGAAIWLPLYAEVKKALDCLPLPKGASSDCEYFFWTGVGARDGHIKTVVRTLQAVFNASDVQDAQSHRFRHTLATQVLVAGGSIEDAANILGDSPEIIRKHYAKWSTEYQRRTTDIMSRVHGTYTAREDFRSASPATATDTLVPEEGVEPS